MSVYNIKIRKLLSVILIFLMLNLSCLPVLANNDNSLTNAKIKCKFLNDINANEAKIGQTVNFIVIKEFKNNNIVIPKDTVFKGEVKNKTNNGRQYQRSTVQIEIKEMELADGTIYKVDAETNPNPLQASNTACVGAAIRNTLLTPFVVVLESTVLALSVVTIVGIFFIEPQVKNIGESVKDITYGANYIKHEGNNATLKLKRVQ